MDQYFTDQQSDSPPPQGQAHNTRRFLFDILESLLLSVVIFLVINFLSARIRIEQVSMQPTLYENDFVMVNRLAYKLGSPGRGDVIVFDNPENPGEAPYIKRVIGLPGDTVAVREGVVYVNGEALVEPYIMAPPAYNGEWLVPEGALFVLGDNRNSSSDSHIWGMVLLENVIGTAEFVYLPPDHWQNLNPHTVQAAAP